MKIRQNTTSNKGSRCVSKTPTRIPFPSSELTKQSIIRKNNPIISTSKKSLPSTSQPDKPHSSVRPRKTKKNVETLNKNTPINLSKPKAYTLQERLQGLVDESQSWTSKLEREKAQRLMERSEVIIRGKGEMSSSSKVIVRFAMTPEAALKLYHFNITSFEKKEMSAYDCVYFVGHHAKKRPASPSVTACNYGYDDERGDYIIQLKDHLDYRYEMIELMGKGSFGQVVKCFDHHKGQTVAVKIIRNKKRFHAQALVEVKILKDLIKWDPEDKHNTVRMLSHFTFRDHLCIVFECLSMNLYQFIKSNAFQGFSMGLIRR